MSDAPPTFRDGRYRIVRVLGEGAQAITYEAVDAKVGQAVAVKRFRVRGAKSWKEVELAEREARVLAGLSHPLLPRYVEHFEEGGELFLVMERIEGETLATLRKRGVSLGEREVRRLLHDAARALAYLHGRAPPIVHRDLKPGNVIRRPDGSFAFIDFGAVRDRMRPEGGSTVVGTFGYMAPEQFQGRAMPASDVYAVGATALSLLTGREPEDLPHRGLALDVPAALTGSRASPALVRVLTAMLVPDPEQRAQAIAPLLEELGRAEKEASWARAPSASTPPAAPPASTEPTEEPGGRSFSLGWLGLAILATPIVWRLGHGNLRFLFGMAVFWLVIFWLVTLKSSPRRPTRARVETRGRHRIDVSERPPEHVDPAEDDEDEGAEARRARRR